MSDKVTLTRARQACEPCRRKKTKCPGEKPVCSFCQRLGQRCSYERGDDVAARVHKTRRSTSHDSTGPQDRLQRLESRMEEFFDILTNHTNQAAAGTNSATRTHRYSREENDVTRPLAPIDASQQSSLNTAQSQGLTEEEWHRLIEIYRKKFDCQPLSVLSSSTLLSKPESWAECLQRSFLSLTIPFLFDRSLQSGSGTDIVTEYANSARHEIMSSVASGKVSIDLLQATCLSAQREILDSNSVGAWMMIGVGIRLALSLNVMSARNISALSVEPDTRSRCCWSLFTLDRIYGSTLTVPPTLGTEDRMPDFPISTVRPGLNPASIPPQPVIRDLGVLAYHAQLLSIWGMVMKYIQNLKEGESEEAWTPKSEYYTIVSRLYDFEINYAQAHRFQQTRFQEHDLDTLEQQRSYWAPWLAGQFLFHAIQGLINHPFFHIASKPRLQVFQPPSFLQNSVDQARLHSSWILKCVEVCMETRFQINDPFIAHLVATTATIYLFLVNGKDEELASQSRTGLDQCHDFVRHMSKEWPHLRHTVDKLDILQRFANPNPSQSANAPAPKAQRSLLWELLDYSASTTPSRVSEFTSDAVDLNVVTTFLSPLNPLSSSSHTPAATVQQTNTQTQQNSNGPPIPDALWDPVMDTLGFNLFDNEHIADLTNLNFGRDIWNFGLGQL